MKKIAKGNKTKSSNVEWSPPFNLVTRWQQWDLNKSNF